MKFLILLSFVLTLNLNATYLRAIHIASFSTKISADTFSKEAQKRFGKDKVFSALQEEIGFKIKVEESGRYFLVKLEPIHNPESLQVVMDIVRKKYKDAYPKKLDSRVYKYDETVQKIQCKQLEKLNNEKTNKEVKTQPKEVVKIKTVEIIKEIPAEAKEIFVTVSDPLYKWLFAFAFLCIIGLVVALFKYKKELEYQKELLKNREIKESESFDDIDLDIDDINLDDLDDNLLEELDNIK